MATEPPAFEARFENDEEGMWLVYPTVAGCHYRLESSPNTEGTNPPAEGDFTYVVGSFRYGSGQEMRWWIGPPPPVSSSPVTPVMRTAYYVDLTLQVVSDPGEQMVKIVSNNAEHPWVQTISRALPVRSNPIPFFSIGNLPAEHWWVQGKVVSKTLAQVEAGPADSTFSANSAEEKEYLFVLAHWDEVLGHLTPHNDDAGLAPGAPPPFTTPPSTTAPPLDVPVRRFYRVQRREIDTNENGLPDWWEIQNGYLPFASGTADPGYANPDGDTDFDGLKNSDEFAALTDPRNHDTDGDLALDGQENVSQTDPTNPNSTPLYIVSVNRYFTDNKFAESNVFKWAAWGHKQVAPFQLPDNMLGESMEIYATPEAGTNAPLFNSGYPNYNNWHNILSAAPFPTLAPWWADIYYPADSDFGTSSILPALADDPRLAVTAAKGSGIIDLNNHDGGDSLDQRRLWLRGPKAPPGGYSRTYVLRTERVKGHFLPTTIESSSGPSFSVKTFTVPEGERVSSNYVDLLPDFSTEPSTGDPSTHFHVVRWSLLPTILTHAAGPQQGQQLTGVRRWMPNNGIGKGPLISGGNPYKGLTVSFGTNAATLLAFGETFSLTETSSGVWASSNSSATVHLLTPREPQASERELLRLRIDSAGLELNSSEYDFLETTENSNIFSAAIPEIRFELPAVLSQSERDNASFDITDRYFALSWTLEETGANTRIFTGSSRVITILSLTSGTLKLRVGLAATPQEGAVYGLQFRNGAWRSHEASVYSNMPPASPSDQAKWHVVIRGLGDMSTSDIPIEFVEEYRDSSNSAWSSEVLGTGVLTSTGGDFQTAKPVVVLIPGSDIDDVSAADRQNHYILQAGNHPPSSLGKRVSTRYKIRAVGSQNWHAGQSFVTVAGEQDAMIMRSLPWKDEILQGLGPYRGGGLLPIDPFDLTAVERSVIEDALDDLGYTTHVDVDTEPNDITEDGYFSSKEILYLLAHGGTNEKILEEQGIDDLEPYTPLSTKIDDRIKFLGMGISGGDGLQITAEWLSDASRNSISPELVMMAGCFSGMTSHLQADAINENSFEDGSAEFADAFRGSAYVGLAWTFTPVGAYKKMKNFISCMDKERSWRDTYTKYLNDYPGDDGKLLKLYKYEDETFTGNDRKPCEKAVSTE